jgi:glycosyltransferase involved in cell wall biosynthesis
MTLTAPSPGALEASDIEDTVRVASSASPVVPVISPLLPHPPTSGGLKRTLRLLEAMERAGGVPHLVTTDARDADAEALRSRGWRVDIVPEPQPTLTRRVRQHVMRRPSPYLPAVAARVNELVRDGSTLVQAEHTQSAYYRRAVSGARWVLSTHNVDSELLRSVARTERPLTADWLRSWMRWQSLRAVERRALPHAAAVLCVSAEDAAAFAPHASEVVVAPNGVDDDFFAVDGDIPGDERVLFFGQYGYAPNRQGITRFLREGWPLLAQARPAARLRLAGEGMAAGLRRLAECTERVEVLGFVQDLPAEIAASRLIVVPVWAGGGTRLKVLESLAAARPLAGTRLGVQGIGFEPGRHGVIGDSPQALGRAAADLLADRELSLRLAAEGRRLAEDFRWTRTMAPAEELYRRLLAG